MKLNDPGLTFAEKHPFVLADGRRFASLYCAAQTVVVTGDFKLVPVIDTVMGLEYGMADCRRVASGPPPYAGEPKTLSAFQVVGRI